MFAVSLGWAAPVHAQSPIRVPDEVACRNCLIVTREVVTLGATGDSSAIAGPPEDVIADGLGRFWALRGSGPPLVYRSTGQLESVVGTSGGGPGEFGRPYTASPLPGDSVLVFDGAGPRAMVMAPDLRFARSIRFPWQLGPAVILAWPSLVVANGNVGTPDGAGWPLHRVAMDGADARIVASFGSGRGVLRPGRFGELRQRLASARDGGFWAAYVLSYRLELWSAAGSLLVSLERNPDWFSSGSGMEAGSPDTPPPSAVSAIDQDSSGLIWVYVRVPARTWREAWRSVPQGAREVSVRQIAVEKLFSTMVEVIDPAQARVVARSRLEQWVIDALPAGRVACYGVDREGEPRIRILQLTLEGR